MLLRNTRFIGRRIPSAPSSLNRLSPAFTFSSVAQEYTPNTGDDGDDDKNKNNININDVKVTTVTASSMPSQSRPAASELSTIQSDATQLVDSLLEYTSTLVDPSACNMIAYSGGVDSSLAAALVHRVFHKKSNDILQDGGNSSGSVLAVLGVSSSLSQRQLLQARSIVSNIGISLKEVGTDEGLDSTYIENKGQACYVCKTHLYSALEAVTNTASSFLEQNDDNANPNTNKTSTVILYNGTNADDTKDPTRLGLIAAKNYSVQSPLIHISKEEVRHAAKHLGLPNWNHAASPCLRSRLALGVEATAHHLQAVSEAEEKVRSILDLDNTVNMRVRMLSGKRAMVELDSELFKSNDVDSHHIDALLREEGADLFFKELGFLGGFGVRPFKSGSVSVA